MKTRILKGKLILGANFDRVRLETEKWIYDFAEIVPPILNKNVVMEINEREIIIKAEKVSENES